MHRGGADAAQARHDVELRWHEEHLHVGDDEQVNRYKKLVLERVRARQWELLGDLTGKRVLEVGCGVGRETVELARRGARVLALDLSPSLVNRTRERVAAHGLADRVECRVQAAEETASAGEQFDVVYGNGILHHLELSVFLPALHKLMAPGGIAQFHEPLIHNPLLRLYRVLTPNIRTPTEVPLHMGQLKGLAKLFGDVRIEYLNLLGLAWLPVPYVLGDAVTRGLLGVTWQLDRAILAALPMLRRHSQYVVISLRAPR